MASLVLTNHQYQDKDTTHYHCITDFNEKSWNGEFPEGINIFTNSLLHDLITTEVLLPQKVVLNQACEFTVNLGRYAFLRNENSIIGKR